jgi:hypothetical protein
MKYGTTVDATDPCVVVEGCVTVGLPAVVVTVTVRTFEPLPQPAQAATASRKSAKPLI